MRLVRRAFERMRALRPASPGSVRADPVEAYDAVVQSLDYEEVACDSCGDDQFDALYDVALYGVTCPLGSCHTCGHVYYRRQPTGAALEHYYNVRSGYGQILARNARPPDALAAVLGSRAAQEPMTSREDPGPLWRLPEQQRADAPKVFDQYRVIDAIVQDLGAAPFREHRRVLEVGCAYGAFLARLIGEGHEAEGVELSREASAAARDLGYRVDTMNVERELPDACYDAVLAIEVVEHLKRPSQFFARCSRVLNSGGLLVAFVPNIYALSRRILGVRWYYLGFPDHLNFFTRNSLTRYAGTYGFEFLGFRTWLGHGNLRAEWQCAQSALQVVDADVPRALNALYDTLDMGPEMTFVFRRRPTGSAE